MLLIGLVIGGAVVHWAHRESRRERGSPEQEKLREGKQLLATILTLLAACGAMFLWEYFGRE
jgi:hypothetical protein